MTHPRISVSAICSLRQSFGDDLAFWARHEVARVGASVAKLETHGWDDAIGRLAAAPIEVANIIGPSPFSLTDESQWEAGRVRAMRILDAARALGTRVVIFTTGPAGSEPWDVAAERFGRAIEATTIDAAASGVALCVEHTNSLRVDVGFLHTLRDAIDLARDIGIGVCMEINACWAERDLPAVIRRGIGTIRVVQISDFRIGTLGTPDRMVPGDGDIPIERIVRDLLDAGYNGTFDLEIVGPRIDAEGYDTSVPRSVAWLDALLTHLGA